MNRTAIEWTDFSSNPLRYKTPDSRVVHACVHASEGCRKCYSERISVRFGGLPFTAENMKRLTPFLDEKELHRMLTYKPASGKRCFVGDMTDIFGEWVPDELLDQIFTIMAERSDVIWQVLTKRVERMYHYVKLRIGYGISNVHLGVSCEDQPTVDLRVPLLQQTPAAKRFVSYEPALGPANFDGAIRPRLDWIIVGGESGPGARPFNIQWARDVIQQCRVAGVACFVKQLGAMPYGPCERCAGKGYHHGFGEHGADPDWCVRCGGPGTQFYELQDRKGGDMSEWADDLRVREFPR